jgi:hypothetical protein
MQHASKRWNQACRGLALPCLHCAFSYDPPGRGLLHLTLNTQLALSVSILFARPSDGTEKARWKMRIP